MGSTAEDRFWAKVDKGPYCWQWTARLNKGYGQFQLRPGKPVPAHRFAYEQLVGRIPEGLDLDHLCRNRACVRPDHLEAVPRRTNLLRGKTIPAANVAKTMCPYGHPYTPENTRVFGGARLCRTCARRRDRTRRTDPDSLALRREQWRLRALAKGSGPRHGMETHCPQGHPYDAANTRLLKRGGRECRACRKESDRLRDQRPERKAMRMAYKQRMRTMKQAEHHLEPTNL